MKLLLVPALAASAYLVATAFGGETRLAWWTTCVVLQALTVIGCATAAATFRRGEHMWLAWGATAAGYAVALASNLIMGSDGRGLYASTSASLACDVTMNLFVVAAAVLFVTAWSRAGLELAGGALVSTAAFAGALLLAGAVNASAIRDALQLIATPRRAVEGWDAIASIAGDVLTFAASVPLLRMAFALRGSWLGPTWLLLGVASASWTVNDAVTALADAAPRWRPVAHAFFAAGCVATACAAWSHRRTVRLAALAAKPQLRAAA